jgi:[ribosomal protein S18]-alanine N-acetyltransferase
MAIDLALRLLGALDLDRAAALHGESFLALGERAWTRQDLAGLLASPGVAGLLFQAESRDVGIVLFRVVADEAELLTLAVRPAERRRGAGRRLLTAVIDRAREAGAQTLFLEVGADNPPARALYEAMGFRVIGTRPAYYRRGEGPPADALIMRLSLN